MGYSDALGHSVARVRAGLVGGGVAPHRRPGDGRHRPSLRPSLAVLRGTGGSRCGLLSSRGAENAFRAPHRVCWSRGPIHARHPSHPLWDAALFVDVEAPWGHGLHPAPGGRGRDVPYLNAYHNWPGFFAWGALVGDLPGLATSCHCKLGPGVFHGFERSSFRAHRLHVYPGPPPVVAGPLVLHILLLGRPRVLLSASRDILPLPGGHRRLPRMV